MTTVITVPDLIGMRATVEELVKDAGENDTVTVDLTGNSVISQGASDEFVRSLAQLSNNRVMFVNATDRGKQLIQDSAERREVTHLVVFASR